jgi:DNA-3-methyladenine glycosylase II
MLSIYTFELEPLAPFQLALTAWTLRRRPGNLIDRWDGQTYRRVLVVQDEPTEVAVTRAGPLAAPRLSIQLRGRRAGPDMEPLVTAALARLLGVYVDLTQFYQFAKHSRSLAPLVTQFRGAKPPRFPTAFETLANAVACQQVSLNVGIILLNRLAEAYGPGLPSVEGNLHAFPRPRDLADADPEALRALGFSRQKAGYLIGLAQLLNRNEFGFAEVEALEDKAAVERLCRLRGVGRWTAEYFLLRGLGRTHIFPGDDVGARNNLQRWLGLTPGLDYEAVHTALAAWEKYGGLIYFHLLLKSLSEKGLFLP